jgi:ribonuclease-3
MSESISFSPEQAALLDKCEQQLGYRFRDRRFLYEALTHSSFADSRLDSYERMEFFGDSILGFTVCEYLFQRFPQWMEGDLTKVKSNVVSRTTCATIGMELGLNEFIVVAKGVGRRGNVPKSLLANAFESLVAAVYLDGGMDAAKQFLMPFVERQVELAIQGGLDINYKSELQQYSQKRYGLPPNYVVQGDRGPDHDKCFKIAAKIAKRTFSPAWGKNKKQAEQRAAANALAIIDGQAAPFPEEEQ